MGIRTSPSAADATVTGSSRGVPHGSCGVRLPSVSPSRSTSAGNEWSERRRTTYGEGRRMASDSTMDTLSKIDRIEEIIGKMHEREKELVAENERLRLEVHLLRMLVSEEPPK